MTTKPQKDLLLPGGTIIPGEPNVKKLVAMAQASVFARDMVISQLEKYWMLADNQNARHPWRWAISDALRSLGAKPPRAASYAVPFTKADLDQVGGTDPE